ncbi:GH24 family phage-related lysozyme (muramidase) [Caldalkalibacillus uzonensis]|uniref:GH24 family phage-related lysozyme (Muramidase) n=1 Tax=Caldalkalibacillus uzonensis TaxID=353224 RepID=A0ABU0CN64_9BACI|nr:hypothetical protein [Caldalkalibacillus uzonensis]MDQ0337850.1 GH24 family phage-related lysozyme (muramidase) [Caldalkalibacillus uzonensis]
MTTIKGIKATKQKVNINLVFMLAFCTLHSFLSKIFDTKYPHIIFANNNKLLSYIYNFGIYGLFFSNAIKFIKEDDWSMNAKLTSHL